MLKGLTSPIYFSRLFFATLYNFIKSLIIQIPFESCFLAYFDNACLYLEKYIRTVCSLLSFNFAFNDGDQWIRCVSIFSAVAVCSAVAKLASKVKTVASCQENMRTSSVNEP